MSVDVRRMVETLGVSLMGGQVLELESDYQQRTGFTLGTLLLFAAQDWNESAHRLVEENAAFRRLFGRAAPAVTDAALAAELAAAGVAGDASLRLADLRAGNVELRRLIIALHEHVEEREDGQARELEQRVWAELVASTDRRQLQGAPF